jgi:hypothetical protein
MNIAQLQNQVRRYKRRHLFSAKGAKSSQPGALPQGIESHIKQALKARFSLI